MLGGAAALGVVVGRGLVLAMLWLGVRVGLDRRNGEAWAREWEQVEPGLSDRAVVSGDASPVVGGSAAARWVSFGPARPDRPCHMVSS